MVTQAKKPNKHSIDKLILSADYEQIFNNRMVVIIGLSRSGTSILGKIVGSLDNVIYLFEPVIMRLLPTLAKKNLLDIESAAELLRGILFEDYFLQLIQGRNLNFRKSDNSYFGNYVNLKTIKERWSKYGRRNDVLQDINNGKYIFALKISEMHTLLPILEKVFKGLKIIHIIRDGNAVISSSLRRGWFTDEFLNMNMIQWMWEDKPKVPWFVPKKDVAKFRRWNRETRIAYIWRMLGKKTINFGKDKNNYLEIKYEDLVKNPESIANLCAKFLGTRKTEITRKNIKAVKKHNVTQHDNVAANIDSEESPLFEKFMKELNYL